MKPILAILALFAAQTTVFGAIWLLMAWQHLSRRASLHWGIASLLLAAGSAIFLLRPWLHPTLAALLPNLFYLGACLLVARGMRWFTRRPLQDGLLLSVVGATALLMLLLALAGARQSLIVIAANSVMGGLLLRAAEDVRGGLALEFGRWQAGLCGLPLALIGLICLVRGPLVWLGMDSSGQPLDSGAVFQTVLALAMVLLGMAMQMTMALMLTLRLTRRLRHLSQHDDLTGLLNRRAFDQCLRSERARQQRQPATLALLAVDLDHFKAVNDRHGHAAGDALLVASAQLLQRQARSVDAVARIGGEEFALLLPGTDLDGAQHLAERICEALRSMTLDFEGEGLRVTASIGVAALGSDVATQDGLLRQADRALYLAKAGGRDRVVCAGVLSVVEPAASARHRAA